ncbi:MAG: hypothetical protein Q8L37_00255 [Candidatus Gottesmanbacteria bacterium]|nr:hypothetical protein [Candidatus Gottesmanbacteria bacterium]
MTNAETPWWQTIQEPNLWWHRNLGLIPVFELTEPSREPILVYASPKQHVGGVDVTLLRTEVSHGLYVTYPEVPIINLQDGIIEYMTITKEIRTVQVKFVGFMDDEKLRDKAWPTYL